MKKVTTRLLSIFLVLFMVLWTMPATTFAADGDEAKSQTANSVISETATGSLSSGYKADITPMTGDNGDLYKVYSISFSGSRFTLPASPEGGSFSVLRGTSQTCAQYTVNENATAEQVKADLSAITYFGAGTVTLSATNVAPKDGDTYYNGHYYSLIKTGGEQTWQSAMTEMLKGDTKTYDGYKGHPVTVTSVGENDVLKSYYTANNNIRIWLGAISNTATKDNSYTDNELNKIPGGDGAETTVGKGNAYKWIWGTPEGDQTASGYANALPDGTDFWKSGEPNANPGYVVYFGCGGAVWDDLDKGNVDPDGTSVFRTAYALIEYSPIDSNGNWIYDENGNSATEDIADVQSASRSFNTENVQNLYYVSASGTTVATGSKTDPFSSIKDAYNNAVTDSTNIIYLLSDLTENTGVAMDANKNVTVTSDPEALAAYNNAVANVEDQKTAFDISRTATGAGIMFNVTGGTLTLTNITLDGGKIAASNNAIKIGSNATVNIKDGTTIRDFYVNGNGPVYNNGGKLNMTGGVITENKSSQHGGGVYNHKNSTFEMSGGSITGNSATQYGGGVCNCGTFTLSGGTIGGTTGESNTAISGGGVSNRSGGTFEMTGGNITGNSVSANGGGVENNNSTFTMKSGNISGNTASGYGGGVCNCANNGNFTLSGGTIGGANDEKNTAKSGGGVSNRSGATFEMTGGNITGNSVADTEGKDGNGGGVENNNNSTFTMKGGSITGNSATNCGGGVLNYATLIVSGTPVITGNTKGTAVNNVYLSKTNTIKVMEGTSLSEGAKVGITANLNQNVVTGSVDITSFFSDNTDYDLVADSDNTVLKLAEHSWSTEWTSDGTSHWYACTHDGCTAKNNEATCAGGTATCTDKAVCTTCGKEYGELDPSNHTNLEHFDAKAATTTAEGNIEYWYCSGCEKYFSDKDGTKVINKADTVIAKIVPADKNENDKSTANDKAKTGDTSDLTLWTMLLFISGGAISIAVIDRRKKYNK